MYDYLLQIKKLTDQLSSIGEFVSIAHHIEAIFDGLPEEYSPFIASLLSRREPYTVEEIEALLLANEERIEKFHKVELSTSAQFHPQGNLVQAPRRTPQSQLNFPRGRGRFGRGRGRIGRGGGRTNSSNNVQCQLCNRIGHTI